MVHRRHRRQWSALVARNEGWLAPWSPSYPETGEVRQPSFAQVARSARQGMKWGTHAIFAVTVGGEVAGQVNINNVMWAAALSASVGYWVGQEFAGRGVGTRATALALDTCLWELGLHRVEVCIRPDNHRSLRVAHKLGLRSEGVRPRYLHVGGEWADHEVFAVTMEERATRFADSL